jgi:hypothetical protein
MSKLKAALVTLLLGTSSAAIAAPSVSFSADAQITWASFMPTLPSVRDHRTSSEPAWSMPSNRTTWISLATSLGLSDGRDVVNLSRGTDINALRLTATRGNTYVQKLTVRFADGSRKVMTVNRWLTRTPIELALDRCDVSSITVTGSASRNTSYQMSASAQASAELPTPPIYQPPVYQPPVYQPPVYQPPVAQQPVLLSSELTFANTSGYRLIYANANMGTFTKLRLQDMAGNMPLAKVVVNFVNGQIQTIDNIDRTFSPGQFIDLRLDPRGDGQLAQIFVYTNDTGTPIPNVITGSFNVTAL